MSRRALCLTAAALAATAWGVHRLARRSGVSPDEAGHSLPGDQIVPGPNQVSTRALTIAPPPSAVWPWVVQMGYPTERAGWYTPHWLDELMWGERPRSAETIRSDLQGLKVGDTVPDRPDWAAKYVVEEVAPPSHPVLHSTWHVWGPIRSSDFSWVFALQPVEETLPTGEATRLVVRARVVYEPKWIYPFGETVIGLGDWLNVSVMLRGDQEARGADGLLA